MPRSGPSRTDQLILGQLAGRGITPPSAAQLERWRHDGWLPRNVPHGLGRGRGSTSEPPPGTVEIAAALARHFRQGRNWRLSIIDWFAEGGIQVTPGAPPVPEPPLAAVKEALHWSVSSRSRSSYRLFQLARKHAERLSKIEDDKRHDDEDEKFAKEPEVKRIMASMTMRPALDMTAMRRVLTTGEDIPVVLSAGPRARKSALFDLVRSRAMGHEAVGGQGMARAFAETAPGVLKRTEVELDHLIHRGDRVWSRPGVDPLELLSLADGEALIEARTTAYGLAWIGWLFRAHGALLPDTPAQQQLRAAAKACGLEHPSIRGAENIRFTGEFAFDVVCCLDRTTIDLTNSLIKQAHQLKPLFVGNNTEEISAAWADEIHQKLWHDFPWQIKLIPTSALNLPMPYFWKPGEPRAVSWPGDAGRRSRTPSRR